MHNKLSLVFLATKRGGMLNGNVVLCLSTTAYSAGQACSWPEAASHAMQHACKCIPLHVCQPQEIMHALAHLRGGHSCLRLPTKQSTIFWLCRRHPGDPISNPTDALCQNRSQGQTLQKSTEHRLQTSAQPQTSQNVFICADAY